MKNVLLQAAMKLNRNRRQRKWWQWAVRGMITAVVFCTTYALILPAITMVEEPVCGMQAHTHGENCYVTQPVFQLQCGLEEQTGVIHSHDPFCCNTRGELICLLPEIEAHTHGESCYALAQTLACQNVHTHSESCTAETVLVCGQEEMEPHAHSESCTAAETVLTCTAEEGETHTHGEGCYETQSVPCPLAENPGHGHSEGCYETREKLCELTTNDGHVHEDACFAETQELICTEQTHLPTHSHSEACRVETGETEEILTCQLPEHTHEDACYPLETEEQEQSPYLCALGAHTHGEGCHDEGGTLPCSIPEHSHSAACILAELDLTADVETAAQWEEDFSGLTLSGNWPEDVLAVAQTQLGYQESVKNVILEGERLQGYTRYGQWYGSPYGDWCAMFASFCLNYAHVEDFPLEASCGRWIAALTEGGLYFTPDAYTPKPGDLIFFDFDRRTDAQSPIEADHVGLVAELTPASEETPARIRTIEGNTGDQVAYVTYDMDDPAIIGYGSLPVGNTMILSAQGVDYTVTVRYGRDTGIPETAELAVEEILPGTPEYEKYYLQSVDALLSSGTAATAEELGVSFARFFDICFLVDGAEVEPAAPVDVRITYTDGAAPAAEESGVAVHFTDGGVEVLDAQTSQDEGDSFAFTQDSFSVVGTVLSNFTRAIGVTTATPVRFSALDAYGDVQYVIYTEHNGSYYALTAWTGDVTGHSIPVTLNEDGTVSWESTDARIFWSFERNGGNSYYVQNYGSGRYLHAFDNSTNMNPDYGTTTGGRNPSTLTAQESGAFTAYGNGYYTALVDTNGAITFNRTRNAADAAQLRLAVVGEFHNVWFDGTNGGMMSYYGSDDLNIPAVRNSDGTPTTITLPETWTSPAKYGYTLQGWYDITTQTHYPVDPNDGLEVTAQISADTVFYADWAAATYDVGQDNENVVNSVDTSDFITTHVFDYNVLFNVLSLTHTGSISATDHTETWSIVNNGTVPYNDSASLGFMFVDYDSNGDFSYANGRDATNINQGNAITSGILEEVRAASGADLLELLFDPDTQVIGKDYVGTGNYLFQYMDSTTENYDGIHDGYYYLDARLNAASYNRSAQRFYLYNYLERTSDSRKDGGAGQYSDFLPFNSPYLFEADQLDEYTDMIRRPGYEYDAKDAYTENGTVYSTTDDAGTNYFFGIRTDIEFYLPNDAGSQDQYGNYGNISTRGEHMVFDFHGDDDVWVFVDGELLLDIGGLHGIMFGQIDFSTGQVTVGRDGGETVTTSFDMTEGTHTMTVYYMERGSSQSNCAIYFNIAPRYTLEITKEDVYTAEKLDGAVFSIYTDEACTVPAQLWDSEAAHKADMEDGVADETKHQFAVIEGFTSCWGVSAGKTYYIRETTPPPGYPNNDDILRITLNNRGTATIETTTLHGEDGLITEGYAVIKQDVNDTLKIVSLLLTNQLDDDTAQIRVKKVWDAQATDLPNSITVYLTANGERVGREAVLSESNGWTYTWTGLPKYESDGETRIEYQVSEIQVSGFQTEYVLFHDLPEYIDWVKSEHMEDSCTYLLLNGGRALAYNSGSGFYWMTQDSAMDSDGLDAQWFVTTNEYGFRLTNGSGYILTYDRGSGNDTDYFYGSTNVSGVENQVIYFLENRLVAHDHDEYFQFDLGGNARDSDGLVFSLLRKDIVSGTVVEMKNSLVDNGEQTFVEVNKVWADDRDHSGDSVTVHLYADGVDTGRFLTLSPENNWFGSFDGLAYYGSDGVTPIVYTVVEDEPVDYDAEYESRQIPGMQIVTWIKVSDLSQSGVYRIVSGANALSADSAGNLMAAENDAANWHQWWTPVVHNGRTVLKHYNSDYYLYSDGDLIFTVTDPSAASAVTLNGEVLMVGTGYLQMTRTTVSVSEFEYNATLFTVAIRTEDTGMPGLGVTVTNSDEEHYNLPDTGSTGAEYPLTFGILLVAAVTLMYISKFGQTRKKGGSAEE